MDEYISIGMFHWKQVDILRSGKSINVKVEINQNGSHFSLAKTSDVVSRVTEEYSYFRVEVLQW